MLQIIFKNMKRSELAREVVTRRIQNVIARFPELQECRIVITLEMHNSPGRARPSQFSVKIHVRDRRYADVMIEKSEKNFYAALADVAEHTLETLNRFGNRIRIKERNRARKLAFWAANNEVPNIQF